MSSIWGGGDAFAKKAEARANSNTAAEQYWQRAMEANNELNKAMYGEDGKGGIFGEFEGNISDYKKSINENIENYSKNMNDAISKYSGENAVKEINNLANQYALSGAKNAASSAAGAMRSTGMGKARTADLINNQTANMYNQQLGNQQQLASNQYANALGAKSQQYGTELNSNLTGAGSVLTAQGNLMGNKLQGASALAANKIGASGQDITNWQQQLGAIQGNQNLFEKLFGNLV